MAIAKRGTRIIVVDGERYRWVVSPDSGSIVLVVERAEEEGQRLSTHFEQSAVITPGVVAAVIEEAHQLGWVPGQRDTELQLWNLALHPDPADLRLFTRETLPPWSEREGYRISASEARVNAPVTGAMTEPSAAIPDPEQAIAVLREAIDILQTALRGMRDLPIEEPERTTAVARIRLATMTAPVLDAFNGASDAESSGSGGSLAEARAHFRRVFFFLDAADPAAARMELNLARLALLFGPRSA
ncbi:hypothetical protein [Streptomyces sp. ME19-01-6]|uniref:hypothetical protein n=1 Tax=Streptomyces sp. ME19-01-6 TaxID=3028686 RepID=UPI0029AF37AE|nr:hypothetical protein [Streptomyces sp. ME19-01-6]MDX3228824.1 hypothetical protein [Streptomyces sp. ME19-01-6]